MEETQVNFFSVLPSQLITRITSRLAIRSIANCMLVSKQWCKAISNPFMAKPDVHFLFFNRRSSQFFLVDDDPLQRPIFSDFIELKPLSLPNPLLIDRFRIHSCNGLVCLSVKNTSHVYIFNPIIGEFALVPKPNIDRFYCDMYDLGFCPTSDRFKLTRFVCRAHDDDTVELEIYTIGSSDGWRRYTGDVPHKIWNKSESAICAKGVLHWLIMLGGNKREILTFDLEEERFGSVPLPVLDKDKRVYKLGFMDDSLVVTAGHNPPLGLEIWARKERGVDCPVWVKNWVVDATESLNQETVYPISLGFLIPRKLSTDGSIFLTYLDEKLLCYGPEERLVKDFLDSFDWDKKRVLNPVLPYPGLIANTATLLSPRALMEGESDKRKREENEAHIAS